MIQKIERERQPVHIARESTILTGRMDLEKGVGSIMGEERWITLNREAQNAIEGGDGRHRDKTGRERNRKLSKILLLVIRESLCCL